MRNAATGRAPEKAGVERLIYRPYWRGGLIGVGTGRGLRE